MKNAAKTVVAVVLIFLWVTMEPCFSQSVNEHVKESYKKQADQFFKTVWEYYRVPEYQLFSEYYPQGHTEAVTYVQEGGTQSKKISFLWPLSGIVSASNMMVKLPGFKNKYMPYLDSALAAVEQYRDTLRSPAGYQAFPSRFEKVDRYYDDNGLVGIDYAEAYENTGNQVYLQRAKDAFAFIISGWSDVLGGGATWLEGHYDQKPACTNGMATLTALKLYHATKDTAYLNWGKRIYDWMKCLRVPAGIYANDIKTKDSSINRTFWTYNSGSMLEASVLLYQFTGKLEYLEEARAIAEGTYRHFGKPQPDGRVSIQDVPWFVTVLFRGYEALYRVDKNPKYVNTIKQNIDFASINSRDSFGLYYKDWNAVKDEKITAKWLLDEACMIELLARFALLEADGL